jgi:tRNA(adenine34) deaminase
MPEPVSLPADELHMREALKQARRAAAAGEVPVGAVLVQPEAGGAGRVLARGNNRTRRDRIVHAHAELVALGRAERASGDFRLDNSVLYVTVEPCLMCLGALLQARVSRVVYGATEPKFGALESRFALQGHPALGKLRVTGGVLADESRTLLREFFLQLRAAR